MTILFPPPAVPSGVYRIRNAARSAPDLYLQCDTDNEIRPVELKSDSEVQQWRIAAQANGTYSITNVGTSLSLSIKTYDEGGQTKQRAYGGGAQSWTLMPLAQNFVIGVTENGQCLDLAVNNWTIIWERNNAQNQRWILDSISQIDDTTNPALFLSRAIYNITNRATNGQLILGTDNQTSDAPVLVRPFGNFTRTNRPNVWTVLASGANGVVLTNSYPSGDRYLQDGPFVSGTPNTVRLIPIAGTHFFTIATSTVANPRALKDPNPIGAINLPTTTSDYNKDDTSQHWEFRPAP